MILYIPFIHKVPSKKKSEQIPLYIEEYDPFTIEQYRKKQEEKQEKTEESVIIIDLL